MDYYDRLEAKLRFAHLRQVCMERHLTHQQIPIEKIHKGDFDVDPEIALGGAWKNISVQVCVMGAYSVNKYVNTDNGLVAHHHDADTELQVIAHLLNMTTNTPKEANNDRP